MSISNHSLIHFDIKLKIESGTKKQCRRNFRKGKYKDIRKCLAKVGWNNILNNRTAILCWTLLKYEFESITNIFVSLNETKKPYRKKHLSK